MEDGHGTRERLSQSEGEIYRDVCVTILNIYSGDYKFKFYSQKNEEYTWGHRVPDSGNGGTKTFRRKWLPCPKAR